jgi:hypothetical protein
MGNTDSSNKQAEQDFVNLGNDINRDLIDPAAKALSPLTNFINNSIKNPQGVGSSILSPNQINDLKNSMNVGTLPNVKELNNAFSDKLGKSLTDSFSKDNFEPIKTTLDTGFSKDNMQTVNDAFEDNLTKENVLIGTPYAIDRTFLLLNATPQGRILTTGLSLIGVDAKTVNNLIGVEPSPVYIVGNAIIDGIFSMMLDPQGGIEGITGFLQNPSLDALGKFAGLIPTELGGTYGAESGNSTRWYLEMGIVVIGGVYIYKKLRK